MNSRLSGTDQLEIALESYERRREEIYRELEIAFVQHNVRCKLLRKDPGIEFLFVSREKLGENIEDLLSESVVSEESGEEQKNEDSEVYEPIAEPRRPSRGLCDYLDLEAEYSGEESEEASGDKELDDIIDNTVRNTIKLDHFVGEQQKAEEDTLRRLREKFMRKKHEVVAREIELMDFESNDEFPEIREFEPANAAEEDQCNDLAEAQTFTVANLNKKMKIDGNGMFNDDNLALHRLGRDVEQSNKGFIQRQNE